MIGRREEDQAESGSQRINVIVAHGSLHFVPKSCPPDVVLSQGDHIGQVEGNGADIVSGLHERHGVGGVAALHVQDVGDARQASNPTTPSTC